MLPCFHKAFVVSISLLSHQFCPILTFSHFWGSRQIVFFSYTTRGGRTAEKVCLLIHGRFLSPHFLSPHLLETDRVLTHHYSRTSGNAAETARKQSAVYKLSDICNPDPTAVVVVFCMSKVLQLHTGDSFKL